MARDTGLGALFTPSYRTGDPEMDALFGLIREQQELPELKRPETRSAPRGAREQGEARGGRGVSNNAQVAYNFYINKGVPPHIAAGWVGSMMQESGPNLDPNAYNPGGAYGIMQAMGPRKEAMLRAGGKGDLIKQLEFSWAEMNGPERKALERMLQAKTPAEAAIAHRKYYERPGEAEARDDKRIQYANQLFSGGYQPQQEQAQPQGQFARSPEFQPHVVGAGVSKHPISQTDPRLQKILSVAAQNSPFDVQFKSGYRPGDKRQHGKHNAIDVQLVDKRTGEAFADYQDPRHFRDYEQFAQTARQVQEQLYPELGDAFRWGGYFSGKKNYGALDLMHFDIGGGEGLGMRGGSWEGGLNDQQRALWKGVQSQGMGQRAPQLASTQESPYYPVRLTDGQIFDVEKGMGLDEVDAMLQKNGINARPLRPYTAPDGRQFDVEYDMTDDEIMGMLQKAPQQPGQEEESNYLGAMKYNAQQALSGIAQGAGTELGELGKAAQGAGFLGDYAKPVSEFLTEKGAQSRTYGEQLGKDIEGTYERPKNLNAVEEYFSYPLAETVGGIAPYVAAGGLSMVPGVGGVLGPAAVAGAVHAGAMGEGEQLAKAEGKEFVPSEYRFPYAAAVDAANLVGLNVLNKALKVFGKGAILGSREAIQAAVEKGGIEEAKKVVGSRLKNVAGEFLKGEAALVSGEVIEDAINREYLGKPLLSEEAGQQYFETFKQVGPLGLVTGPMAGLGTHYNKAIEVARLEEQQAVQEALAQQEAERQKIGELRDVGVSPAQLEKFKVKNELEGLSDEDALAAYKADQEAIAQRKAAKIEELPEELRDVPYKEAKVYQQMQKEQAEVPSEEVSGVPEEPSAPVEPVSGVTPPAAEMGAEEIPEPFVRGRAQEVQAPELTTPEAPKAPEVTNPADILGLKANSGLRKQLQNLDVNNAADHPKIDAILQKTSATFSAENLATLETKMKEVQNASQVEVPKPSDAGRRQQPQGGEEVGYTPVSGEGVRISDQEGKGITGEGKEGPIIKEVRGVRAPEIEVEGVKRPTTDSTGAPIHTTEEGVKNFWKGFKDTKVVDAEGRPLKLYTGTSKDVDFTKFKAPKNGVWFTPDAQGASQYAIENDSMGYTQDGWKFIPKNTASRVMPVYVALKNPKHYDNMVDAIGQVSNYKKAQGILFDRLKAEGYDGVVFGEGASAVYVAFSPNQIKSAIGNKGGFDVTKPDIREVQPESPDIGKLPLDVAKFQTAKNARELLNTFSQHGTDENLLKKAKIFLTSPHAGAVRTHFVSMSDPMPRDVRNAFENRGALAATSIGPDKVEIYYRKDSPEAFSEDNALHEVTHALTEAGLQRNPALNTELNSLAGTIGKAIEKDHPEAAAFWRDVVKEDGSEALAYGATSPTFRKILSQYDENGNRIPEAKPEIPVAQKPRTLWDRFKSFVGKLFGVPDKQKENFSKAVDEALAKGTTPVVKPVSAKLDEALVQAFKDTAKRGITKPKETVVKEVRGETPTPKPSKEELAEAEKRLKDSGMVGAVKDRTLGTKMRDVVNDIFKEGRNTSFVAEAVDIRQPISKAVQPLPDIIGEKLRSDYIYSAYEQRGNVIQESYRKGFVAMGRDGTIEVVKDIQLALAEIFKRVGAKNQEIFSNVLVALRVRTIRAQDAEIRAQANKLLNMAEEMQDYASTLKDAAKRKKFNAAARSLTKIAEKNLERINWEKGRTEYTDKEVKDAETVIAGHPELAREAENVYALLRKSVDLWESEGLVDADKAKEWKEYPNYFPLYKVAEYDEHMADPSEHIDRYADMMGKSPKNLPTVHAQERHAHQVFVEDNLLRHISFFASAAAEHSARKNTAYNLEMVGKAERIKKGTEKKGELVVKFRENGKDVFYRVDDAPAYYAMQSAMPLMSPLLKRMRSVGNFARGVMIMNPLFWYRQAFREPIQASLVGRAGVISTFDTLGAVSRIASGSAVGYERLRAKGVIGPVDIIPDPAEFIKVAQKGKSMVAKGLTGIKHVHEAMDAATRVVVYEKAKADALSKGFDEETADAIGVMKAREIINFAKQGRNKMVRAARATTPFFGAALNSLDVMARAAFPSKIGHLSKAEAMEARRNFYSTAFMLATFSTAYAAAMSEDEDYLKEPDRIGNWLIPIGGGKFIKIPIPFEAGWFTKELPELTMLLNMGAINTREALTEARKGFTANVLPPMITIYAFQPFLEIAADHDFFTGSSLEGRDAEVAVRDRNSKSGELTKAIINKMEDAGINIFGMSANQLEHLNKKFLGQLWAVTRTASDAYINRGRVTPEKELTEMPLISGAVTSGTKDRAVDQFYTVAREVSEVNKSFERAKSHADKKRFDEITTNPENAKAIQASKSLRDKKAEMGKLATDIEKIKNDQSLTSKEMTSRIKMLKDRQRLIAKLGVEEARKLGLDI
jgi:hypothetical protein